jgi:hypothetical protein
MHYSHSHHSLTPNLASSQQHHRLAPTAAPPANPSVIPAATNPRLNEFFDLIKGEFDAASQDGSVWKSQRDEYEQKSESELIP